MSQLHPFFRRYALLLLFASLWAPAGLFAQDDRVAFFLEGGTGISKNYDISRFGQSLSLKHPSWEYTMRLGIELGLNPHFHLLFDASRNAIYSRSVATDESYYPATGLIFYKEMREQQFYFSPGIGLSVPLGDGLKKWNIAPTLHAGYVRLGRFVSNDLIAGTKTPLNLKYYRRAGTRLSLGLETSYRVQGPLLIGLGYTYSRMRFFAKKDSNSPATYSDNREFKGGFHSLQLRLILQIP